MGVRLVVAAAYAVAVVLTAVFIAAAVSTWLIDSHDLEAIHTPRALPDYHFVEHGETLWEIANHYWPGQHTGRRVHDIVMLNDLANEPFIYPGQRLRLVQSANDTL